MQSEKSQQKSMRNQHGVEIKKCCASCRHKKNGNDGGRICSLMQIVVGQQFTCPKWAVADGLMNAGRSQGKVKRHEYLMFVFETRMQEREAIDSGLMLPKEVATLDSLRERFEKETGLSPFIIH
jgi:hypothetical protein